MTFTEEVLRKIEQLRSMDSALDERGHLWMAAAISAPYSRRAVLAADFFVEGIRIAAGLIVQAR